MKNKFIIYTPPWRHNSAGVQILHRLCHQLRQIGQNAFVTNKGNPDWDNPVETKIDTINDFVIYPDIVHDNPFLASHVIRYMLYYPQCYFHRQRIPANELLIPFAPFLMIDCKKYYDYPLTEDHILELSIIDVNIFKEDLSIEKNLNTFWLGKGTGNYRDFHLPADVLLLPPDCSREDLAKYMQRSKNVYCFDINSTIPQEAFLCGANVFIITESAKILQWYGRSKEQESFIYNDLERIKKFVELTENFFDKT